jgi:4,5-DOPA dioxygenase extradiol
MGFRHALETPLMLPIMPTIFIGHGSPMNAIEDNAFRRSWQNLGQRLPTPKAILCISAHWETRGIAISTSPKPGTIHDFYGFPKALFDVQYPAPGSPELANEIADLLADKAVYFDPERGFDHGVWSVLQPMYPQANIPIVQLSLDTARNAASHYELARKLQPLREQGILVIGSGNIVHNLRAFNSNDLQPYEWANSFDHTVKQCILQKEHSALCHYENFGEMTALSIPSAEHYLPLLYVLAQQRDGDAVSFFNETVLSSISMRSVHIG